jgi:hypothetical protein
VTCFWLVMLEGFGIEQSQQVLQGG